MEAKELMIGDLVMSPTITPELRVCRIVDVNGNRDCVGVYDIKDEDEYLVGKYAKYLEPIPLTPDMLKVNGWSLIEGGEYYHYDGVPFVIDTEQIGGTNFDIYCSYDNYVALCINFVHELQHALRLCGLNELADNFKV